MKLRYLLAAALLLFAVPASAQSAAQAAAQADTEGHSIFFDGFSFTFPSSVATSVNVTQLTADDLTDTFPPIAPHVQLLLYGEGAGSDFPGEAPGAIRLFRTADFEDGQNGVLDSVRALLNERPSLTEFIAPNMTLPFLPLYPAGQVVRARAQYVDNGFFSGISYVTAYQEAAEPLLGSQFVYTFQGVSIDGAYYVSAIFRLNTDLFPAELPSDFDYAEFSSGLDQYLANTMDTLNAAAPDDFTPSLADLDSIILSFAWGTSGNTGAPGSTTPGVITPEATTDATAEATAGIDGEASSVDTAMNGLGNTTWTLVSLTDALTAQAALAAYPTITFTPEGVSGNAGCNQFRGPFEFENNTLTIGELVTTRMACGEAVMSLETAFLNALQSATAFEIANGQLRITYDGGVLTFSAGE